MRGFAILEPTFRSLSIFLAGLLVFHLVMAALLPPPPDEAYYNLWADSLQWGYYDHPPMIAAWIRGGHWLFGDNWLGMRALCVVSSILNALGIYALAREFGVARPLAIKGAVWTQCVWSTVQLGIGGFSSGIATPNAPATFFWVFACVCTVRAASSRGIFWWLVAGGVVGLGFLSKYTCFFLLPGLLLWLATSPRHRHVLATPGPWLAVLTALAVFVPHLVWNSTHEWQTFIKQFGRVAPDRFSLLRPLILIELVINLGPGIAIACAAGAASVIGNRRRARLIRRGGPEHDAAYFVIVTSSPLLLYTVIHAFHSETMTYWLCHLYPGFALVAALAVKEMPGAWRTALSVLVPASAICVFLFFGPYALLPDLLQADQEIGGGIGSPRLRWYLASLATGMLSIMFLLVGVPFCRGRAQGLKAVIAASLLGCAASASIFWTRVYVPGDDGSWERLASAVGEEARKLGAHWVGAATYQTHAYLHPYLGNEPGLFLLDRGRAGFNARYPSPSPAMPGLLVHSLDDHWLLGHSRDRSRLLVDLHACFGHLVDVGTLVRETHSSAGTRRYTLHLATEPLSGLATTGC